jgi:VPDSG-CTERM motif
VELNPCSRHWRLRLNYLSGANTYTGNTNVNLGVLQVDGQFSVLDVLGTANLNGNLAPVLLNGFVPDIGQTFTFLNYASFTGAFSQIQHQVFNGGTLQWSVIYQNTNAILTVEPHTPGVPDQGSTCVLLTLGLLGLVTFRRQLLRGQP